MDDESNKNTSGVQADNQSIAIGGITVGGDVSGNITIGTGYTSDQVSALITQIKSTFQLKPFDGHCPYKGLDVFEEDDAELFFGREKLVEDFVSRVKVSRTVFITGPSGSGKSSLVRAGLIHALKQGKINKSEGWLYGTLKPGRDPLEAFAAVFSRLKSPELGKYFRDHAHEPAVLNECAESVLSERKDQRLVLFIDQFEEVFTQVDKEPERTSILALLTHAATVENGRVILLFSMRSDFVSNCATYPELNALLNQQFIQIGAMQPDELVSAIAQPALRAGLGIDPDLIAQIINDMQGEPGVLPLMSFALKDLFDKEQASGGLISLTLSGYLKNKGINEALQRHADAALAQLSDHEKKLAQSIFSNLIEIGRGTQDTKRTALFDELVPAHINNDEVKAVIQKLADARLVTTEEGSDKYTITHEKLIDAWPWLKKLVNENRDVISLQNEIAADAKEWEERKRDASYLYTGGRLETVREQFEKQKLALSHLAQEFVRAGRARQQRTRTVLISAVSAVLIAAIVASVAFQNQAQESQANAEEALRQAKIARAGELAAVSNANLNLDPELSLHLAMQSVSETYTLQGEDALRRALLSPPVELTLYGHSGSIYSVAYDNDGKRLVTTSEDGTARIWDAATGRELILLIGHTGSVFSAAFSPNGQLIATAGADKTVCIWNADTGKLVFIIDKHDDVVNSVAFSPDGQRLMTASKDKTVRVWDIETGKQVFVLDHTAEVRAAAFGPHGKYIATGGYDQMIYVWNAVTGKLVQSFENYPESIITLAFSPDEQYLLVDHLYSASLWNIEAGFIVSQYSGFHTWYLNSVTFSPDGKQVVTASSDHTLGIWDTDSGNLIETLRGHNGVVFDASFDPTGDYLATASEDQTVRIWNIAEWRKRVLIGYSGYVSAAVYSPDGQRIATVGNDGMIRVWDVSTKRELNAWQYPNWINRLHFSPDSQQLITSSDDSTWQIWDAATGQQLYQSESVPYITSDARFNQEGTRIITTSRDGLAVIWDAKTKQQLVTLTGHENGVWSGTFSPDGQLVVTASADGTARIWNTQTGEQLQILTGHNGLVGKVAFSSDGKRIVTAGVDNTARIWDTNTGQQLYILKGHTRELSEAVFSPDGQYIATASRDHTIILWNANTGDEIIQLFGHNKDILSLAFSPDGCYLLTASEDGTVRIYPVYFEDVLMLAQTLLSPRELTCAERLKYLHEQCLTTTP